MENYLIHFSEGPEDVLHVYANSEDEARLQAISLLLALVTSDNRRNEIVVRWRPQSERYAPFIVRDKRAENRAAMELAEEYFRNREPKGQTAPTIATHDETVNEAIESDPIPTADATGAGACLADEAAKAIEQCNAQSQLVLEGLICAISAIEQFPKTTPSDRDGDARACCLTALNGAFVAAYRTQFAAERAQGLLGGKS